ncbi:peptidylprolyl isomerase [Spirosoma taeanense]|uniref:Peptidyl-prolyl cis-trans isomerase n=1 Tax=Spirosoma taeanense TaxID=2735870 RepID=A0A6M5Y3J6_9BACT|nr:FKBP-type peptidyl-prolyl cis-trans isomerase [Spirosoma taeanense]QJW87976.1 peptidylprolyl isomerase [Spirosoma taeanense]
MKVNNSRLNWIYGLLAFSAILGSCQQPGEDLTDRKRRENEAEIDQYIKQNNLTATKTEQGIYFIQTKSAPTGQAPQTGDEVRYHYITRRLDGVIVDSSDIAGSNPATVILAESNTTGITLGQYAGVLKLRQGEEGSVLVPAYLDGGRIGTLLLPQYSPVRYDLRIVSVRTEEQRILDYISANKLTVTTKTDDGLRVIKTLSQPADSMAITTGKTVTLNYTGKRLNGTTFDASTAGTFQVKIGEKRVVPGFENGLATLRAGEKATLIFPSSLGYGVTGTGSGTNRILPYTPLLFEITIVKVE